MDLICINYGSGRADDDAGMTKLQYLQSHGLFDARVPRYTSYPPANRFLPDVGRRY